MKEQKKKKLIAILLLVSCFISGFILFSTSDKNTKRLSTLSQADSLIQQQFSSFNIPEDQISVGTTRVDSNFYRKTYFVGLPYRFSKTQFHAELNDALSPFGIRTPARVTFPQKNVNIQLSYRETVIRTISLQTDPELSLQQNDISLLLAFGDIPESQLISQLNALAEPIPLVLKIEQPMQVQTLKKELNGQYASVIFWFQNKNGDDLIKTNPEAARARLDRLQDISPNTKVLVTQNDAAQLIDNFNKLTFVDASNAQLLHEQLGKKSFLEELTLLQSNTQTFLALITGTETTVEWLIQKLPDLKKAGARIIPPPKMNL
ncbi:hypothetical protein CK503_10705 [Aliifodinibius salipaludis]|uniref:Uncharacterized protein n=1 Tax=Fodinibius salipaludis TaxID=2032627 RepID=A0A2A2G9U1_9BACT|nr:hypothetical protein [Aliifodinibius salipaludis]PAU93617.1 hypothetical protein CK503_10705 [Aliifodinibius salipaludis]